MLHHYLFSRHDFSSSEDSREEKEKMCHLISKWEWQELNMFLKCDIEFRIIDEAEMYTGRSEHQTSKFYLQKSVESKEDDTEADGILCRSRGEDCLLENLGDLCLIQDTATAVIRNMPKGVKDLLKPTYWTVYYLDFVICNQPVLFVCPRYPQHSSTVDEWFHIHLPTSAECEGHQAVERCLIRMINVSSDTSQGNTKVEEFLRMQRENQDYRLLYHSTVHRYAMSIITDGIILTRGRKRQDFSSKDGFYLSENFENARRWTNKSNTNEKRAIIVYKIRQNMLDAVNRNGLDLTTKTKPEWDRVIKCCRNDYKDTAVTKYLDNFTFIRGPICLNPGAVFLRQPLVGFEQANIQFCIRDDDYAEAFGSLGNIGCVIFY